MTAVQEGQGGDVVLGALGALGTPIDCSGFGKLDLEGPQVLFYGPVLPGEEALRRLLRALEENGPQPTALDAEVRDLVQRLQ